MSKTHFTPKSENSKLGEMAATYRTSCTCPDDCPLKGNGCYAWGRIFSIPEKYGTEDIYAIARRIIDETPQDGYLRWEVSGDVVRPDGGIDWNWVEATNFVATVRPDIKHLRYTHAWRRMSPKDFVYATNASCETPEDVEEATRKGWDTVITVTEGDPLLGQEVAGKRIVQCPNQTHGVTCSECRLCHKSGRRVTIGFAVHGPSRRKAKLAVEGRRQTT